MTANVPERWHGPCARSLLSACIRDIRGQNFFPSTTPVLALGMYFPAWLEDTFGVGSVMIRPGRTIRRGTMRVHSPPPVGRSHIKQVSLSSWHGAMVLTGGMA